MLMSSSFRKFALITHVTASVGWIGAVVAYLALVGAALTSQNTQLVRACWVGMNQIGWFALVPLSFVALLTGLVMSLGTKWGLFQHYWVLFSLALTIFATVVLLVHMQTVSALARVAADMASAEDIMRGGVRGELLHAGVGLLVLLAIQVLNVYKPRGVTPYGWRRQPKRRMVSSSEDEAT